MTMPEHDEELPQVVQDLFRQQAERTGLASEGSDQELKLRFVDSRNRESHVLTTGFLGVALTRLQSALNWAVWSQEAGPQVSGEQVPAPIARIARTEVTAFQPGSFQVALRKAELEISESFDNSIDLLLDLAVLGDEQGSEDGIAEVAAALGPHAVRRAELLFKQLGEEGQHLELDWRSGTRRVFIASDNSRSLAEWLGSRTVETETIEIAGSLEMADSAGRFRISTESGSRYEGRSKADLAGWTIGARCQAQILVKTSNSTATPNRVTYQLDDIQERN